MITISVKSTCRVQTTEGKTPSSDVQCCKDGCHVVIINIHNSSTYTKKLRSRFSENHHRDVDRPKAIGLYSKYMSGVDITDQQLAYNSLQHRMLKWWKKVVLCNLLEITMANAKVIYKEIGCWKLQ